MKKSFVFSLLAVLAITGCQAELEEVNPEITTLEESKVFTASIDDGFSIDTRTSLDGSGNVFWKLGDQVSIFAGSTVNEQYQVSDSSDGKTTATLNKVSGGGFVAGPDIDNNVAFYPYASTAELVKSGSNYVIRGIDLPATQTYAEGSFGNGAFPMAAETSSKEDMNFKFKNVLGGLKLQLKGTATITSISVTGNNEEILCGNAEVTVSTGSIPTITLSDASAKTVILNCGAGVTLDSETATPFIIALPPMTMTGGFKVTVTDSEGKQMEIKTTKSQTITRSYLLKMPVVTYEGTVVMQPLTFTSTGSTSISLIKYGSPDAISLEYKVGDGEWTSYTIGEAIDLTDGQKLLFRAGEGGNASFSKYDYYYRFTVTGSGTVAASGNIMSLLNQEGGLTIPSADCFCNLFYYCSQLTSAPELPATTLSEGCYFNMFYGCTSLTTAPKLPATTLAEGCYLKMFYGCTSLTTAPKLPATTLAYGCYWEMFYGCTGLTSAPELPATILAEGCYDSMFYKCAGLASAPELPATTLAPRCYKFMFSGCTGITTAPELPATTLADDCYHYMFSGCTGLTSAPELPATTLAEGCYEGMFGGCTGLTTAPALPVTTLAEGCYEAMFSGCTGLTSAPELPVTTLADYCYTLMFNGCTGLTSAPELPATTLADWCYHGMFQGCTGLTSAPELPATTLADWCYRGMFQGCTGLTTAPELPATTLTEGCYYEMFKGCTKLNYIKALFTTTPSSSYTENWVAGVAAKGTFVKSGSAIWDETGDDGIPSGWTIIYQDKPLTFRSTGRTRISLNKNGRPDAITIEYKVDDGEWGDYTIGRAIDLNDGQVVFFRAGTSGNSSFSQSRNNYYSFTVTGSGTIAASGDIMYLIDKEGCLTIPSAYYFCNLFFGCEKLTSAPELPATTLTEGCYYGMFNSCSGLTSAPELPATTLTEGCYYQMFYRCSQLNYIKALFTTTPSSSYTYQWVYGVAVSGTFVKSSLATWYETGFNAVPLDWTVLTE